MIILLCHTDHWISQFLCFISSSLLHRALKRLLISQPPILQQKETKRRKFSWWLVSTLRLAVENVAIRLEKHGCLRVFCDVPPSNLWFLCMLHCPLILVSFCYVNLSQGKSLRNWNKRRELSSNSWLVTGEWIHRL